MPGENLFLSVDGIEIEDCEEGDYTAYEMELGAAERMISGRRVEELRATVWVVEMNLNAVDAETMAALNAELKARRQHELFFLPSTGGTELATGKFHLVAQPAPTLKRWGDGLPKWDGYKLVFEEVDGHD